MVVASTPIFVKNAPYSARGDAFLVVVLNYAKQRVKNLFASGLMTAIPRRLVGG